MQYTQGSLLVYASKVTLQDSKNVPRLVLSILLLLSDPTVQYVPKLMRPLIPFDYFSGPSAKIR
jgi:hypothetical protein